MFLILLVNWEDFRIQNSSPSTRDVLGPTRETLKHRETFSRLDLRFLLFFVWQAMFALSHYNGTVHIYICIYIYIYIHYLFFIHISIKFQYTYIYIYYYLLSSSVRPYVRSSSFYCNAGTSPSSVVVVVVTRPSVPSARRRRPIQPTSVRRF